MVELGKYASTVLSAYAVTLTLLAILVVVSLLRARRVRADLAKLETKRGRKNG